MKNLLSFSFCLFISLFSFSQFDTTSCTHTVIDTLKYTINKSNTPVFISMNTINNDASNSPQTDDGYSGYAQLFEAPDSVSVNGFCFYAFMNTGTADSLLASLYLTNQAGELDSLIDSIWVTIPLKQGYMGDAYSDSIKICVNFDTTFKLKDDFVISLENQSSSDMYITRNNNGQQEDLSYTFYSWDSDPQYNGWYKAYPFGVGWDFDLIIEPIVSYTINTQHLTSQNSNCFGDTIKVSSSITYNDSLLHNKMYNPDFSTYNPTSNFGYHYGDTSSPTADTSHVYTIPGAYNALFFTSTNMSGWTYENYTAACGYYATAWGFDINLGQDTSLCVDSINLSGGQFFDTYLWNTTDTTDILTIYADSLNSGQYQYSLRTDYKGCYSYDTINITVGELPISLGNDTTLCLNQQLNLSTGINGNHNWNTGQLTDSIKIGPFNNASNLIYIVEVEQAGCFGTDTINITIDNCVGVEEKNNTFTLYPNPAKDNLTIKTKKLINSKISLIDMNGRIIYSEVINNKNHTINVSDYENGVYILSISNKIENYKQFVQIIK